MRQITNTKRQYRVLHCYLSYYKATQPARLQSILHRYSLSRKFTSPDTLRDRPRRAGEQAKAARSDLVLVEHHVGDALVDGEAAAGIGADEGALLDVDLEERVVDAADGAALDVGGALGEDLLLGRLLLGEELGEADRAGGGDERAPVDLGEEAPDEVGVELHLLGAPLGRLQRQRVAGGRAPDVRRQHVVRQEPHLSRLGSRAAPAAWCGCGAKP